MLPYNLVAPMMRGPPFPSRDRGMTEVLGFPGGGGCISGGVLLSGAEGGTDHQQCSRLASLGFGGMITPSDHRSAGCHKWLRSAGGCVCILSFLCLNKGSACLYTELAR